MPSTFYSRTLQAFVWKASAPDPRIGLIITYLSPHAPSTIYPSVISQVQDARHQCGLVIYWLGGRKGALSFDLRVFSSPVSEGTVSLVTRPLRRYHERQTVDRRSGKCRGDQSIELHSHVAEKALSRLQNSRGRITSS